MDRSPDDPAGQAAGEAASWFGRPQQPSLRRNFAWTLAGNVVYAGCQWGMLIALAKLGSAEMVGRFALALAVSAPVFMFTNLQLRAVLATDAKGEHPFGDYFGLRLVGSALGLMGVAVVALAAGYPREAAVVIMLVGAAKCVESVSDVVHGLFQRHERMDIIAISLLIKGPVSLAALGLVLYLTGSLAWAAAALAAVWAAVLAAYDLPRGKALLARVALGPASAGPGASRFRPSFLLAALRALAWLALPMGAVMMLISLNANVPRYFLESFAGERALGFYAAMAYPMAAGTMIVNALGQSASPRLARYYADGDRTAFRKLLLKMLGVGSLLGAGGIVVALLAGRQILALIYRPEYAQHVGAFALIMTAAAISWLSSFLGYGMTAARFFRVQVPLNVGVVVVALASCAWLIPEYGLTGAAVALMIAAAAKTCASSGIVLYVLRDLRRRPRTAAQEG